VVAAAPTGTGGRTGRCSGGRRGRGRCGGRRRAGRAARHRQCADRYGDRADGQWRPFAEPRSVERQRSLVFLAKLRRDSEIHSYLDARVR